MPLDEAFITYIVERLEPLGTISAKRMFDRSGIFCDGKMYYEELSAEQLENDELLLEVSRLARRVSARTDILPGS